MTGLAAPPRVFPGDVHGYTKTKHRCACGRRYWRTQGTNLLTCPDCQVPMFLIPEETP